MNQYELKRRQLVDAGLLCACSGTGGQTRSSMFERLESRHLLATNLVISEFLAVNDSTVSDEDGDFSDWIEVRNLDTSSVNLNGWHVTDDSESLSKWQFPNVSIPAGSQLLVFASNKDRSNPTGELHTNFRLSGGGDYLALVEPDGSSIAFEYAPQFPAQTTDVSYGLSLDGSLVGFFPNPTPGAANVTDPIADVSQQIVITEIMYHPFHLTLPITSPGENTLEEFIEIYNRGQVPVDLTDWSFDRGINFVFPEVTLEVGSYLVVASDVPTFQAQHPTVTNVVGGWEGKLSNSSEEIRLVDELGEMIDTVTYADQGDWAVRAEGPLDEGFRGWVWEAEHGGDGKTLELENVTTINDFGQNWSPSIVDGGTPGGTNSVATTSSAPLILDVIHLPTIPRESDPVSVTAQIVDQSMEGVDVTLFWRVDETPSFQQLTMEDDGRHADGAAGDSFYGAILPAQPDNTVVEFYVHARDAQNNVRTWPAPTQEATTLEVISFVEENATARAFVPIDGALGNSWTGGNEPFDDTDWTVGTTGLGYETELVSPPIASPVAYWPLDELTSGGVVTPDIGGRYDGIVSGATLTTDGRGISGEALAFDGDGDYVLPGVISELVNPSAFSISLWFRRTVDHAGEAAETNHFVNNVLIAQSSNFANDNLEIGTEMDAVELYLDSAELGGSNPALSQSASIQNDTWHHLVVSYDSSDANELKLYVDGLVISEQSNYGGLIASSDTTPFSIGLSRPGSAEWGDFEGLIDDLAVWDVALDAQHVTALFGGTSPALIAGYENSIGIDLQSVLQNQQTSSYARIPFTVSDLGAFNEMKLRMKYDDAFVAYVNGVEVARAGVTGAVQWDSLADEDRPDVSAFRADEFNIANRPGLFVQGANILAIQMLNSDTAAARALALPELVAEPANQLTNAQYQVLDSLAGSVISLVNEDTNAWALVPTDDSLGTSWTATSFNEDQWASGTLGVGYDTEQLGAAIAVPLAYWTFDELQAGGTIAPDVFGRYNSMVSGATQTVNEGGKFGEALAFDGENDYVLPGAIPELSDPSAFSISLWFQRHVDHIGLANETNHSVNNVLIAQSSNFSNDNLEIGTEGGEIEIYLDTVELGGSIPALSQPASVQNNTWHHLVVSYDSDDSNELKLYVDGALVSEHSEYGGLVVSGASPFSIGLSRPESASWGDFEGLIDDVAVWNVALDAPSIASLFAGASPALSSGYQEMIGLDLQSTLQNQNTSAYIRVPFNVSRSESFELLKLRMNYDDAFVAYVNGTEVARSGVNGIVQWNSAADVDRPDVNAVAAAQFFINSRSGLLVNGTNVLAIQLLNFDAAAARALVRPELEAVRGTLEPGSRPVYHQIMTAVQRSEFEHISRTAVHQVNTFRSNAQMNATFIALTDTDVDVRYTTGIRLRGNWSRGQTPPNNRINIPSDRPWNGLTELTINVQNIEDQLAAYTLFSFGGLASSEAQTVYMYSNGRNLRGNSVYAQIETLNTKYATNHFPLDNGGNLYKGRRAPESLPGGLGAGLTYFGENPTPYVSYQKQTNKSAQDWSDVINLTYQLNNAPDETFLEDVAEVVDIDQWLLFFAMNEILNNAEGGLISGDQSGGDEYAMYRGGVDTRFQMVPIDLDEMFGNSSEALLRFAGVSALNRLVNHVDVLPEYGAQVWELANVVLTSDAVKSTLVDALGPLGSDSQIRSITSFLDQRRQYVNRFVMAPVTMNLEGGHVEVGTQITLSSSSPTIYYTTDGSDPRLPGGEVNPQAVEYTGQPIVVDKATRIFARAYDLSNSVRRLPTQWSGKTVEDFIAAPDLVVSELNYNPYEMQPGEFTTTDRDDFEFVEVMNIGVNPIDLNGVQFVQVDVDGLQQGIQFSFTAQTLQPSERLVVVKNRPAFESRYGTNAQIAAGDDGQGGASGEYGGRLSNGGERVTLVGPSGVPLYSFNYNDAGKWPRRPDGDGSSLELAGVSLDADEASSWRASVERGGSPGAAGMGDPGSVVINEVLTNTPGPVTDAIEFYNPTADPIDLGDLWLTDSLTNLENYVIPVNTIVPAKGYLVLEENDFNFGLNGTEGEDVVLVKPANAGNPDLFLDHVSFGPALPGESFGRWPNETGILYPMLSTTFGAANDGPRTGPLVISEVMYNSSNSLLEFVEIYNPTSVSVDLTGWTVDGIGYEFPAGITIDSGKILVLLPFDPKVPTLVSDFNSAYDVDIDAGLSIFMGPYPGQLDNGGEVLTLRRMAGDPNSDDPIGIPLVLEDQVDFDDIAPWPIDADGSGNSLHRTLVDRWGNYAQSWESEIPTPGKFGPSKLVEFAVGSTVIGEVGTVTDLTHEVQTITLSQPYMNPVVFAQPASFNGIEPIVVRVTNVQSNQFDMFLAEPSNLNGLHNAFETVSYVVLEEGSHWLSDGMHLEVGTIDTSLAVGANISEVAFEMVRFSSWFAEPPVVLSQLQTTAGELFLSTRQKLPSSSRFEMALEPEEQFGSAHEEETVGYLAIDSGAGVWNGMPIYTGTGSYYTPTFRTIPFPQGTFSGTPNFLASLASYNGSDNSHLRFQQNGSLIQVLVEEDTTWDDEIGHTAESVSYLGIGGSGPLTALSSSLTDGLTRTFNLDITSQGVVNDLNVNLELIHTLGEDLDIFLESPEGTLVELLTDIDGNQDSFSTMTLDDEATESISSAAMPFSGKLQPEGSLQSFDGDTITGTWILHVTDDTDNGHSGALLNWSLVIELGPQPEGNLNYSSQVDAIDIDMLFANLGSNDSTFDVDGDGSVDLQDVDHLVRNIMDRRFGDADLDRDVDHHDFRVLAENFDPQGVASFHGWAQGDFDGDEDVDVSDAFRLVTNYSPLGYGESIVSSSVLTGAALPRLNVAAATLAMSRLGTEEGLVPILSKADATGQAESGPIRDSHPQTGVDRTRVEYFFVDDYFRSARRRHSDWFRGSITESD